jgi:hypothetical protein
MMCTVWRCCRAAVAQKSKCSAPISENRADSSPDLSRS